MCFSAEVSFGAAVVISTVSVVTLKKATTRPEKIFALIPVFFALQQWIEGVLWIIIPDPDLVILRRVLNYSFLSVAWVIWPILITLSTFLMEKKGTRKQLLAWCLGTGISVALFLIYIMIFKPIDSRIANRHIDYHIELHRVIPMIIAIFYLIPTVVSLFISSVKHMWLLGAINLTSYLFTKIYFTEQVISVWCFFGAISSLVILYIIHELRKSAKESRADGNQSFKFRRINQKGLIKD